MGSSFLEEGVLFIFGAVATDRFPMFQWMASQPCTYGQTQCVIKKKRGNEVGGGHGHV